MRILRFGMIMSLVLLVGVPVLAADDAVIETLQTDVSVTKTKATDNANKIKSLEGGLPDERLAREEADIVERIAREEADTVERIVRKNTDEVLKLEIENIQSIPGPQGPQGELGPEGPVGPSDAYATYLQFGSLPPNELPSIGKSNEPHWQELLVLPPGNYVLIGTVHVANYGLEPGEAWCGVSTSNPIVLLSDVETAQIPGSTILPNNATYVHPTSIAFNLAVELSDVTNYANIGCFNNAQTSGADLRVMNYHFSAIKVGTLTYQP